MDFIKRILNTKKIKETQKVIIEKTNKFKNRAKKFIQKADDKLDISEKFEDIKDGAENILDGAMDKVSEVDEKFKISQKAGDIKDSISEIAQKTGDKIEAVLDDKISFNTFSEVEIKIGKVLDAEPVLKSEKLLKLSVDFGKGDVRQIISGIAKSYSPEEIKGKKATFVTNLEPRKIMGLESDGMILGVSDDDNFSILIPENNNISEGVRAG